MSKMNLGQLEEKIDALYALRQEIREFNAFVGELKEDAQVLEEAIGAIMNDAGLSKAGSGVAQISLSTQAIPIVAPERWEELRRWILDNDYQELLPRSLNQAPYRELINMGVEIPFVESFDKVKMSVRKTG